MRKVYVIYDGRALTESPDDAAVLCTAGSLGEAKRDLSMFPSDSVIYEYDDNDFELINERCLFRGGKVTGKVIRLVNDRGFGFIRPDGGGEDVFFHMSGVRREPGFSFDSMKEGMEVEYDEDNNNPKGRRAVDITRA